MLLRVMEMKVMVLEVITMQVMVLKVMATKAMTGQVMPIQAIGSFSNDDWNGNETSPQNINSRYCNPFATTPSFSTNQWCGSPSRMKPI